jgi:CBS domain-containing protein
VKEILLLPIGGVATLEGRPATPRQEIVIALAGPAVNVVLALVFAAMFWATGSMPTDLAQLSTLAATPSVNAMLLLLASGNTTLALFNLLPIFPLDGGRVLRAGFEARWGFARATTWATAIGQVGSMALLAYAVLSGQMLLGLIAVLVFFAAGQEHLQAQLRTPMESLTAGDVAELPAVDLDANLRVEDAKRWLLRTQQSSFPVVSGEVVLGVLSRAELLAAVGRPDAPVVPVRALMREAPELDADLPLTAALAKMRDEGAPVAVVFAGRQPVGLLSEPQVLAKLSQAPTLRWKKPAATKGATPARSALDPS